ncbi:MAG: CDP-glycerol glycerophosphotransferase family protein [Candidatus Cloacimonadales bacterium]|nr:CDP-glycerol glycerophosphotransferase family protein [Candidatus Cloacimonadales bacterium]
MKIYYYGNQIYQLSFALPFYRNLGGIFIVNKPRKFFSYKLRMINANIDPTIKTFLNTPRVERHKPNEMKNLEGIIVSQSNQSLIVNSKKCKTIFVGHGTGDKRYGGNANALLSYDYLFISGDKHLVKLKDEGVNIPAERLIKIGNPRFDDYVNGKIDRDKEMDRLGIKDRTKPNILYAPTWRWGNGTFRKYVYKFAREMTSDFNLIVRPHHHDAKRILKVKLFALSLGIKNLYFSNPNNIRSSDTMNDFMVSDLMISDTSSIVYEYLITKKPLIIIRNDFPNLHNMPDEMNIMKHVSLFDNSQNMVKLIKENLENQDTEKIMNELLFNCFYFNDGKSTNRAIEFIKSLSA